MSELQKIIDTDSSVKLDALTSNQLTELQTALASLRFYPKDKVDGLYGPLTKTGWTAFKASIFQSKPDLVGAGSLKELLRKTAKPAPTAKPTGSLAERIYQCCQQRGYKLDERDGAINIIGVEGLDVKGNKIPDVADGWNDVVIVLVFKAGVPVIQSIYQATTEPGKYYTFNPLNKGGAARLQLGQHKALWAVGQHRGYQAMQQVGSARLVRDRNRNFSRDDKETVESGNGINLHTSKTTGWRGAAGAFIGQWSAGCVVIKDPKQFLSFMTQVKSSLQYRNNRQHRFDFTLLWQDWI